MSYRSHHIDPFSLYHVSDLYSNFTRIFFGGKNSQMHDDCIMIVSGTYFNFSLFVSGKITFFV